jgi:tetratricopeptide (TPR) repeat protein
MKRFLLPGLLVLILVVIACIPAFAQSPQVYLSETDHYRIYSELSAADAKLTASKMEAFLELFNQYMHFDLSRLPAKLNVRIFSSKERFDDYLESLVGQTKDNFVFLQYSTPEKSELLGFSMRNEDAFETSLVRHGFIQFLKTFVRNPPLWIQQGFAVFFEKCDYDEENDFAVYTENLSWLETLGAMIRNDEAGRKPGLLTMAELLNPSEQILASRADQFHAQAWGLVYFLINSANTDYNRILWDSLSALETEASLEENLDEVRARALQWTDEYLLASDYADFIASIKTFPDLVRDGIDAYEGERYTEAEDAFVKAIALNGNHHIPYYYLGLINYSRGDYSLAEYYYQSSLMLGAEPALIYYALGVNAFSDNRFDDARDYLAQARERDPNAYRKKVSSLLERIDAAAGSVRNEDVEVVD